MRSGVQWVSAATVAEDTGDERLSAVLDPVDGESRCLAPVGGRGHVVGAAARIGDGVVRCRIQGREQFVDRERGVATRVVEPGPRAGTTV